MVWLPDSEKNSNICLLVLTWSTNVKKIAVFMYRIPHFSFPWRRPCDYHAMYFMDGKTIQCLRLFLPHFCLPWGRPWGNHTKCCMDGKRIRCIQIVSQSIFNLPIYLQVSQLIEPQVQKIAVFTYCSPHFWFPWRRPCDYHAICFINGKTIQCLPNASLQVPIYLQ